MPTDPIASAKSKSSQRQAKPRGALTDKAVSPSMFSYLLLSLKSISIPTHMPSTTTAMMAYGRIGSGELAYSLLALLLVGIGLLMGKALRQRLDEILFLRVLTSFLSPLAVLLLFK